MIISIVIPAFNEEDKIQFDIESAVKYIKKYHNSGEVIIVDDGSTDRTADRVESYDPPDNIPIKILNLSKNEGKGAAVKRGVLYSSSTIVLYADSGMCIPYENANAVIERIKDGELEIALASRRHRDTVIRRNRTLSRRILSRLFRFATRMITGLPAWISDSQCGFKVYKGDVARELFSESIISGFMFEIEFILRALKKGYRIEEFPVEWSCDLDTRLRPRSEAASVLKELLLIRNNIRKNSNEVD